MRQLSPLTNLLLSCLSALGLVAALGLPWFAPGQSLISDDTGLSSAPTSMETIANRIGRTFSDTGQAVTGGDAAGGNHMFVLVVAGLVVVLSTAMLVPALRGTLRDVLRAVALASPVFVVVVAVQADTPALEVRWGLFVELGISLFMASAAWHGATIRTKRARAAAARPRAAS